MALSASTVFEIQSAATAGNVNGGGFNPTNAGMLTDLTTDANTANTSAPIVSSASYNFVAGDVGNWLYIKSGTSWTPGWYKIISVASNKATLSAAVGSANVVQVALNRYGPNTVIGCATVGTPTAGTFTIDYSQKTAAIVNPTDLTSTAVAPTVLGSVSNPFTPAMVGNLIHITTTGVGGFGIVGWYEIVSYTGTNQVTVDRATNTGTAMAGVTGYLGGALSLANTDDDAVFELAVSSATAAARYFIKGNATYTLGGTVTIAAAGNAAWPIVVEGYNAQRGDRPLDTTRPTFALGAAAFTFGASWSCYSMIFTGTNATMIANANNLTIVGCKAVNVSTTAARKPFSGSTNCLCMNNEFICYRGIGLVVASSSCIVDGCYIHDCDTGINGPGNVMCNTIIAGCITVARQGTMAATSREFNNTFYGAENKLGIGVNPLTGSTTIHFVNNIIYGFVTGVSHADVNTAGYDDFNNYFNNTNDVNAAANWQKGQNDTAINPSFTNVSQVTGTTGAFTAGNSILVDTSKNFTALGVVAGRDYLYITGGTGVTNSGMNVGITSISTTTNPNDTLNLDIAQGTNTTADKTYQITVGRNFAVGSAMKGLGYPGSFPAGLTTGYLDAGAVQRQESGAPFSRIFTGF